MGARRHPTHGNLEIDGQPTIIFDTVCTKNRVPWLANEQVHEILKQVWLQADRWLIGRYVIMPDHIHFFAGMVDAAVPYENWVRYWKSMFTKTWRKPGCVWLTDHWDTRVRSSAIYEEKWTCVRDNPVRKQLVDDPDKWPYQGEIFELRWDE